jgi:hypothetical protein
MYNDTQLATLRTELSKATYRTRIQNKQWQQLVDALNLRATVANPVPQPSRPKLIAWNVFLDLLTAADVLKVFQQGVLADHLKLALEQNNRVVAVAIWRGLKTLPLQAASVTAVEAEVAKTEGDPSWPATVQQPSIAMNLGLPVATLWDVQSATHNLAV